MRGATLLLPQLAAHTIGIAASVVFCTERWERREVPERKHGARLEIFGGVKRPGMFHGVEDLLPFCAPAFWGLEETGGCADAAQGGLDARYLHRD
ncbi:hypothetical protein N658DRAFT_50604 [Parathielavia hyrcaniae]|uniref:Uncharacterized protein n=1 Tax=Parathielavia hyrcaniae TaxID=113614 RepID=A0AAN6Q605_9PEZI|nr:hypothetical protein N658DRAFT_50604 [Parathielavia hyrcaniae]